MVMGFNVSPFRHYWFCGKCPCAGRDSGGEGRHTGSMCGATILMDCHHLSTIIVDVNNSDVGVERNGSRARFPCAI